MCAPAFGGAMYFRRKTSAGRAYLQIVESRREGDQVRQQVIATLGRFEDLQASGQLERLLRSGARFAAKAMMLSAAADDAAIKIAVHRIGAALVFERLWEETGFRRAASRTWWRSGCSRIGAICHAARPGVHGHHEPLLRGRRRPDAGPARLQQGPPP